VKVPSVHSDCVDGEGVHTDDNSDKPLGDLLLANHASPQNPDNASHPGAIKGGLAVFAAHMSRIPSHTADNGNDLCAFEWYGFVPAPVRHDDRRGGAAHNQGVDRWEIFLMSATQEGERALHISSDPLFLLRTKVWVKEDGVAALNVFLFIFTFAAP